MLKNPIKICAVILAAVTVCLCGCQSLKSGKNAAETMTVPEAVHEFNFSVLKAGQADAMILQTENHSVIIDCGEKDDGDKILEYLSDKNINYVDYLFITHFDKDHVGGAPEVISNIEIGQIITPDYAGTNNQYKKYIKTVDEKGITPLTLTENMTFILDDVLFEIYPPERNDYAESDNDFSLAIGVTHGDNSFLFAGDAEAERLSEIISQTKKEYYFLKFPHHGRYNKNTQKFIDNIKPEYSVITCSEKNPAEDKTVEILESANCKIYYTKDGNVNVMSNGSDITVSQ